MLNCTVDKERRGKHYTPDVCDVVDTDVNVPDRCVDLRPMGVGEELCVSL